MFKYLRLFSLVLLTALCGIGASNAANTMPTILLDPGHTPAQPGATSIRGISEVIYNDHFTAKLAYALRAASFNVVLTRQPHQSIGLTERAAVANSVQPKLFLSIHHDSVQPVYLKKIQTQRGGGYQTIQRIAGYSIFVSKTNTQFSGSYRFAELLGHSLLSLGRPPTLHHAEDIAGERRELFDRRLGIYRFDKLAVLAKTQVPAVLLEIGVIVDAEDEHYVSVEANQDAMCRAIVAAVRQYVQEPLRP